MTALAVPEIFRDERGRAMGKYERACWLRHDRDLALASRAEGHPLGFVFDPARGQRVIDFVEHFCRHYKGEWAGRLLKLEEWQKKIIRIVFGWVKPNPNFVGPFNPMAPGAWVRRFRIAYIEIARKNGKSLLAAALGLYLLIADGEEGAEIYASATKLEQAEIVWTDAVKMVRRSPELRAFLRDFKSSIVCGRTSSFFKPLAADSKKLDGLNPHGNVVDELHAHPERGLWDVLQSAMGARRQPLTVAITTAGQLDTESIGYEQHEYAQKVLDGEFEDDTFFAFIAAADEGDDHFGDLALEKANPNIDISAKRDYLHAQAAKARRVPNAMPEFLTKHLNVWTQQTKGWIALDVWKKCEPMPVSRVAREEALLGMECFGGLDLSEKLDLCALVLEFQFPRVVGVDSQGEQLTQVDYVTVCRFWLPKERLKEYALKGQRFFEQWERDGWITTTPGNVVDHEFIQAEVVELSKLYRIRELAYDPWKATQTATKLVAEGVQMVECRQGFKTYAEPVQDVEVAAVRGNLKHGNNPVLRWCVANAVVVRDAAGNQKLDKSKSKSKIDGAVALVMARSRAVVQPQGGGGVLDQGGVLL